MNILSLFDGISSGRVASERAGIQVDKYYASEIDKYAIQVTMKNYPDTVQIGDVEKINFNEYIGKVDMLIGGSPCQGFSFAGKQLNFMDPRSRLFFKFVEALETIKPKYFLLENVKMKKEYQDVITKYMGVEPIEINSSLVSAQNRKRLYWTNIPNVEQPEDKGVLLKDIVHEQFGEIQFDINVNNFNVNPSGKGINGNVYSVIKPKSNALTTNKGEGQKIAIPLSEYIVPFDQTLQILEKEVQRGKVGYFKTNSQGNRVYHIHDKSVTLCGNAGGRGAKTGLYLFGEIINDSCLTPYTLNKYKEFYDKNGYIPKMFNPYNCKEITDKAPCLTAQGNSVTKSSTVLIDNSDYLFGCISPDRLNKRQNGQRFSEGKKFYTLTAQDKHGILIEGYIRKLTPIECERLQTLPDNYTGGISNSQRYKALGNGWTIDVIAHIFSYIKQQELLKAI